MSISEELYDFDNELSPSVPYIPYDGVCSNLVQELLLFEPFVDRPLTNGEFSLFVPIPMYDNFIMEMRELEGTVNLDEHLREWDYDLHIDDAINPMKLVWCKRLPKDLGLDRKITTSFSFLEPNYLSYMDKPFWNPDVITQVNLVLDYHRTQKRRRGIEIFNIFDLIAFKMAIDDNRYDYENCEFHKIIDRTLGEIIQSGRYKKGNRFNLGEYMHTVGHYAIEEFVDYLVYHFQKTISSIYWSKHNYWPNKLSSITNVPAFLDYIRSYPFPVKINKTDSDGKCAEVLYEFITKSRHPHSFEFVLDNEWIYSGDADLLKEKSVWLPRFEITIRTKNSFHFIENFINWMKLSFDNERQKKIRLRIENCENINPQIFNNCHFEFLHIVKVKLDHILINKFKKLKWIAGHNIGFFDCPIANDINERFEFIRQESANSQNIFKLLDELDNVTFIDLKLEEHTIGTMFAYVESVMRENNFKTFKFKNDLRLANRNVFYLSFMHTDVNTGFDQIEVFDADTNFKVSDFYEFLNGIKLDQENRDEYDFYK